MSLKIYFCGSIRAGRDDAALYAKIIDNLKTYGTVLTEHVGDEKTIEKGAYSGRSNNTMLEELHNLSFEAYTISK